MNTKTLPVFIVTALYLLAQLGTGTSIYFAIVISIAVFCGLLSVSAAGGIRSALGALNAILLTKFLLLGIAIKVFTLQAADSILRSPSSTANVMALGFLGLLLGTLLCRYAPKPPIVMVPAVHEARMYLALTIVFTVVGFAGDLLSLGSELQGNGLQTGGILGVARTLSVFKSFGPIAALYFAWANNSKRYLTHPLVLFVVALNLAFGIFSTSKQGIMEPIAFYLLMGFLRYGFRSKPLWGIVALAGLGYGGIVYPYSQYVRNNGGRTGDLSSRLESVYQAVEAAISGTLPEDRYIALQENYLGSPSLSSLDRFAMIGEADRLIAGTEQENEFTGWQEITWGFKLMAPSWIFPDKPIIPSANLLGHIANDLAPQDHSTQMAYGSMADFYNAFSYPGVLFGSVALFAAIYYLLRVGFGNPRGEARPFGSTIWFIVIIAKFHHGLVEDCISGIIPDMIFPFLALALYSLAKYLAPLIPLSGPRNRTRRSTEVSSEPLAMWAPQE
jgi:hypothetical protein